MKRLFSLLFTVLMLCGLLAGCTQGGGASSNPAGSSLPPASDAIPPAHPVSLPGPESTGGGSSQSAAASQDSAGLSVPEDIVAPEAVIDYEWRAITTAELNFRKGPGTGYDSMGLIPEGTELYEIGSMMDDHTWIFVAYGGKQGWVATEWLSFPDGGIAKPVIYLYPEETTDVQVKVGFTNGGFTCTYPDYRDGWSVTARPDGTLTDKADGLEYSYLYWEGESRIDFDMSAGFVVKGADTAAFLREKLAALGLTPREYNEFIVYWLPQMQHNPYNLVTFQTGCYTDNVALEVTPKPDSLLRVYMVYAPLDAPIEVPEPELAPFEREGFAVVEWGGGVWAGEKLG